jgi:ATP-dependent RNA helicase DeaD
VIGQAYTGSGKTLAFGLPLIERCDATQRWVQALVLTPTRELARQVGGVLAELAERAGMKIALLYGGRAFGPQETMLNKGAQIVVGTPGRILDHLRRRTLRLEQLRVMVLDEADEMLDMGFAPDVERILAMTPRSRQTSLFSATTPAWVHTIAARHLVEPAVITSEISQETEPDIDHVVVEVWQSDKFQVLRQLLSEPADGATLVFGRTKHGVRTLGRRLEAAGYGVAVLQGNLSQDERDRAMQSFRSGRVSILVATNVAARGLDLLSVGRVINYELPETADLFTHRVGRTGRMGRSGRAITLLSAADLPKWHEIERDLGRRLPRVSPTGEAVSVQPPSHTALPAKAGWRRRRWSRARMSA